jgi:hypothetical protein
VWALSIAAFSALISTLAFGNDVLVNWLRGPRYELALFALSSGDVEDIPTVGKGIKVSFVMNNLTKPEAEIHNVFGHLWTDDSHLLATLKEPTVNYRERRETGRVTHDLQFPVFPKTAATHLPTWIFRSPELGQEILFGAQLTSTETDKRQYLWRIINSDGKPRFEIVAWPHDFK